MRFGVTKEIFKEFPTYCVGVVVAKNVNNLVSLDTSARLTKACNSAAESVGAFYKEHPMIKVWRDAFTHLGYNPNRFPPSIDALISRAAKTRALPSINPAVDILNAYSLTYLLPMGAHDLQRMKGDLFVRTSEQGEVFHPMGKKATEVLDAGEFVYADSAEIRTRRWIWRQGDNAKITEETKVVFCPIDGFGDKNLDTVLSARDAVAASLYKNLGAETNEYLVNAENPIIEIV